MTNPKPTKKAAGRRAIATRTYELEAGRAAVAKVYAPVKFAADEWRCAFTIDGLKDDIRGFGPGVDSVQALGQALQGIRYHLERCGEPFRFQDMDLNDSFIAPPIPDGFGLAGQQRIERVLVDEQTKIVNEELARRKRLSRRK